MNSEKIIYSLNVGDIQHVAEEVLERELTDVEINEIIERVGDYVNWYDAIETAINEKIKVSS